MNGRFCTRIAISLICLVIIYFVLSPLFLSSFVIFLPKKIENYDNIALQTLGASAVPVTFKSPSKSLLYGVYFKKPNSPFTVLLHHGQGGNLSTHIGLAKTMLLANLSVLIYDYEGFGKSEGSPSIEKVRSDGLTAYDFLVNVEHISPNKIIQCGFSLGTGVASYVAMLRPCAAVILISPYTSLTSLGAEVYPFFRFYPKWLFPSLDMGSLEFMESNKNIPVLLIHGANDALIDKHHSVDLSAITRCPHWLIINKKVHHGDYSTLFLAEQIRKFVQYLNTQVVNAKVL